MAHPRPRWGVPHPADGGGGQGYPIQVWTGGAPSQVQGGGEVLHHRSKSGRYPIPGEEGTPHPGLDGVPPNLGWDIPPSRTWWGTPQPGMGYPPVQIWMGYSPVQTWGGISPPPGQETEQHSEHLLRGGRYASCVHAGGLSCSY